MATINGTNADDTLIGNSDGFYGNEGADTINGLGGNDLIDGRGGTDTLNGGDGDDTFLVTVLDSKLSTYDGGAGVDTLSFAGTSINLSQLQFDTSYSPLKLYLVQSNGTTNSYFQKFAGNIVNVERIVLGSGNDSLTAAGSVTYIDGGPGDDGLSTSFNSRVPVSLYGGDGNDLLKGYYNDVLIGGAGNDFFIVDARLNVGAGDPGSFTTTVDGGSGTDTLQFAAETVNLATGIATLGQQTVRFTGIENLIVGTQTTAYGDDGPNTITGASLVPGQTYYRGEVFYGLGGDDTLVGSALGDLLDGGDGNDVLDGQGGINTLLGGAGVDTVVIHANFADATFLFPAGHIDIKSPNGSVQQSYQTEIYRFNDLTVVQVDGQPLVDDLFYLSGNKDVAAIKLDADTHYAQFGWKEGRDPDAYFSTAGYLNVYADVKAAGLNPLAHYDQFGWKEGRDPSLNFDTSLYLLHNPDVAAAAIDPLAHFLASGRDEGRQAYAAIGTQIYSNGFDPEYYLLANPDVAKLAASAANPSDYAYRHYETTGWKEGRNPNAWFDDRGYLSAYKDVSAAGLNPLDHYATIGWREGRDPSAGFDTRAYLNAYADVSAAGINPLEHYLDYGAYELRSTFGDGAFS